jgi:hypothetical protein
MSVVPTSSEPTADPSSNSCAAAHIGTCGLPLEQIVAGTPAMTNPCWQDAQEFFSTTAAKHATPTAQVFHAFNGPDGTNDPRDRGLITADGLHPSEAGALLIFETIHDLAYDFAGWPNSSATPARNTRPYRHRLVATRRWPDRS